ncbi:MAG: ribonuclease H family protein [Thermoplasmata archaeon]
MLKEKSRTKPNTELDQFLDISRTTKTADLTQNTHLDENKDVANLSYSRENRISTLNSKENVLEIEADASFKNRIGTVCVILKQGSRRYAPKTFDFRPIGPVHAELHAIYLGLKTALEHVKRHPEITNIKVSNDNKYAVKLATGQDNPRREYIIDEVNKINALKNEMISIQIEVVHVKGKHLKRADNLAKKKRESVEKKKAEQIREREEKLRRAMERSKEVKIVEREGRYVAMGIEGQEYIVSLSPPSCECEWWKNNWGNKPEYVQKARALPCKHMCALANHLGTDIRKIFEKPLGRVD